ncbi:Unknown protein [Striga hermonthica]|uniref:GRF-type domain-containing protein n=1 Tax=Striga hermonthica TaxID=68872 RepID=A0A9N7RFB2_STRHE|nr:Unknown protein [Striga hermonthica]
MSSSVGNSGIVFCHCGKRAQVRTSWTQENPGRRFNGCKDWNRGGCTFFFWADPPIPNRASEIISTLHTENEILESELKSLEKERKRLKTMFLHGG